MGGGGEVVGWGGGGGGRGHSIFYLMRVLWSFLIRQHQELVSACVITFIIGWVISENNSSFHSSLLLWLAFTIVLTSCHKKVESTSALRIILRSVLGKISVSDTENEEEREREREREREKEREQRTETEHITYNINIDMLEYTKVNHFEAWNNNNNKIKAQNSYHVNKCIKNIKSKAKNVYMESWLSSLLLHIQTTLRPFLFSLTLDSSHYCISKRKISLVSPKAYYTLDHFTWSQQMWIVNKKTKQKQKKKKWASYVLEAGNVPEHNPNISSMSSFSDWPFFLEASWDCDSPADWLVWAGSFDNDDELKRLFTDPRSSCDWELSSNIPPKPPDACNSPWLPSAKKYSFSIVRMTGVRPLKRDSPFSSQWQPSYSYGSVPHCSSVNETEHIFLLFSWHAQPIFFSICISFW